MELGFLLGVSFRLAVRNCRVATTDLEDDVLTSGQKKYIEAICFKEDLSGAQKDKNSDKGKENNCKIYQFGLCTSLEPSVLANLAN